MGNKVESNKNQLKSFLTHPQMVRKILFNNAILEAKEEVLYGTMTRNNKIVIYIGWSVILSFI